MKIVKDKNLFLLSALLVVFLFSQSFFAFGKEDVHSSGGKGINDPVPSGDTKPNSQGGRGINEPILGGITDPNSQGGQGILDNGCEFPLLISEFSATSFSNSVKLSWLTPVSNRPLIEFDLRYSESSITEDSFYSLPRINTPQPISNEWQSVTVSNLQPNKTYYFAIKLYNDCDQPTPFVSLSVRTLAAGGGAGGGSGSISYCSVPPYDISVLINSGKHLTESREILLTLNAKNATKVLISNYPDFREALWEDYVSQKRWLLSEGEGLKTVYVRFANYCNLESRVVSNNILFKPLISQPQNFEEKKNDFQNQSQNQQVVSKIVSKNNNLDTFVPLESKEEADFNALMINWNKKGVEGDFNRDGKIDYEDVLVLLENNTLFLKTEKSLEDDKETVFRFIPSFKNFFVEGQEFEVVVLVENKSKEKNYSAQLIVNYPDDLLEVKTFYYWQGWLPILKPDYDENKNGLLIKTAGFPEGFTGEKVFGVIRFVVKKTGEGILRMHEDSFVLDKENKNVLDFKENNSK